MQQVVTRFWFPSSIVFSCLVTVGSVEAQIVPDTTLPVNSRVMQQGNTPLPPPVHGGKIGSDSYSGGRLRETFIQVIEGGTQAGGNLFHSFLEFSVPTGGEAFFNNAIEIQNIFSRVTGRSISHIDGLIRANGTANLFLINPNGIIFGPNARLNIGGSFLASTANSIRFADGIEFSATNPQNTSLLTINVPLGLQYGSNPGNIQVQQSNLNLSDARSLALVGGNVSLDGASLQVLGGRVELGSVAEGTVGLNVNGSNLNLSFPNGIELSNVSLIDEARVNVAASGGGSIAINAQNLDISGESTLSAGIEEGKVGIQAGDIEINASGAITITSSTIENLVRKESIGNAGNININTRSLLLSNGGQIDSSTSGKGDAGNVTISAQGIVSLDEVYKQKGRKDRTSGVFSWVTENATGNAGDISINAQSLFVTNGGELNAQTEGKGNAGNLRIIAQDTVSFDGVDPESKRSSVAFTRIEKGADGKSGDIYISARSVSLTNGAELLTDTKGEGNSGNITIIARESVLLDGVSPIGHRPRSAIISSANGRGKGGDITIEVQAGSLFVTNGAMIDAATNFEGDAGNITIRAGGAIFVHGVGINDKASSIRTPVGKKEGVLGNAGNIRIETGSLFVTDGGQLNVQSQGRGNAGNITIIANDTVSFDGTVLDSEGGQHSSVAFSRVEKEGVGNSGDIYISARSVSLKDGGELLSDTKSQTQGNSGNITIIAKESVSLDGVSPLGGKPDSGIISSVNGRGKGGDIRIEVQVGSLSVTNGAKIDANTNGEGDAGNLTIFARDAVTVEGVSKDGKSSGLRTNSSQTSANPGGNLSITTGQLTVRNGADVSVRSTGSGNAGSLTVNANSIILENGGKLSASTELREGGNIDLQVQDSILMRRNSLIEARANNKGNGGNITINSPFIVAFPQENSDIIANAFQGRGGNIRITAEGIYGLEYRPQPTNLSDINASSQFGVNGVVEINTPDVDPSSGLVELPNQPVNLEIVQDCQSKGNESSVGFFNVGRGGLAANPYEPLSSNEIWEDVPSPTRRVENAVRNSTSPTTTPEKILEAQGWIVNQKGEVVLVASIPATRSQVRCRLR